MSWFEQGDAEFFNQAADPTWRAKSKKQFARGSAFHFWPIVIATVLNVCALGIPDGLLPALPVAIFRGMCFATSVFVIHFAIMYAKLESYSLVLKYIDRTESERLTASAGGSIADLECGEPVRSTI